MSLAQVKYAALCRRCKRELEGHVSTRANGRVSIELRCAVHGSLRAGERYLTGYVDVTDDDGNVARRNIERSDLHPDDVRGRR